MEEWVSFDPSTMKKAIFLTSLAIFLVQLDATILYVAYSSIADSFTQVSTAQLAWILNVYTLTFGATLIPAGAAGDRFGRKKIFITGTLIFTLASFLCGVSNTPIVLIAMRFLQAIGAALLVPTSLALLLEETPKDQRTIAVSAWGASAALGAAVGPALGGVLISAFSWHWVFFINVPVGLFVAWSAHKNFLQKAKSDTQKLPSFIGVGLIMAAMVCLSYSVLAEGKTASEVSSWPFAIIGLTLLAFFIWHSNKSSNPLIDVGLFRNPIFTFSNVASFLYFLSFSIIFFGNVQSLINEWHQLIGVVGFIMLPGPLCVIPSALLSGRYAKQNGHRRLLILGALLVLSGILLQMYFRNSSASVFWGWLPGWILIGIGNGMVMPSLATAATIDLPAHQYSAGSGVNNSIRQFGSLLGIAIAVAFIGNGKVSHQLYQSMFLTALIVVFIVGILSWRIDTRLALTSKG